ncbi:MAG: hypothetical protein QLV_07 [Qinghai Lake virophage]|jgi:hypothetical protein|uniref:Uncharacterized protein n=1 Tax=Qinghai Lake virophage TaxID=1516115 RepID=A0A0R5K6T9_9VIRU|nr:MAG: hypothetical protein QLV_07 [Qinghai Lake virophage]
MVNYENDYIWGEYQQRKIFPILETKWLNLEEQARNSKYDFISENVNMEIKSRTNAYNKYPTTLLTCNKVHDLSKTNIFVFNFVYDMENDLSDIYYIEYDEAKFSKYTKQKFSRANQTWDEKDYYYIPITDLIFFYKQTPKRKAFEV